MPKPGVESDARRRRNRSAALVLTLSSLLWYPHSGAYHRFHAPSDGDAPAITFPTAGEREVVSKRPPFVPVVSDPLPDGLYYAVTPGEVAAMLDTLPGPWRETVAMVRLCYRPDGDVMAETDGEDIELHYVVNRAGRAPVADGETTDEEERFGGHPVRWDRQKWVQWPDHGLLKAYVLKHLLIHEVGHHLAPAGLDEEADEAWAEDFAFQYYNPDRDSR